MQSIDITDCFRSKMTAGPDCNLAANFADFAGATAVQPIFWSTTNTNSLVTHSADVSSNINNSVNSNWIEVQPLRQHMGAGWRYGLFLNVQRSSIVMQFTGSSVAGCWRSPASLWVVITSAGRAECSSKGSIDNILNTFAQKTEMGTKTAGKEIDAACVGLNWLACGTFLITGNWSGQEECSSSSSNPRRSFRQLWTVSNMLNTFLRVLSMLCSLMDFNIAFINKSTVLDWPKTCRL